MEGSEGAQCVVMHHASRPSMSSSNEMADRQCFDVQCLCHHLEELEQYMPVTFLAFDAGHVLKGVHLDVVRKELGQNLC